MSEFHAGQLAQRPGLFADPVEAPPTRISLVRVLGPLALDLSGKEVRLIRSKPREIFLLLLLRRGRSFDVASIADVVWGSDVPRHPREAVRSYLWSIRRWIAAWPPEIGGLALHAQAGAYALEVDDNHLDLALFTRFTKRGHVALHEGLPGAAARDFDQALKLFRGAALQDASNCTFAIPEIARLEEMRLDAREARALALLELGVSESAIADLWDLATEYPCRARSAALLMVSLYRARRQVEALECAEAFRRALWTEFRERPDRPFLELEQAILNQDAGLDAPDLVRTAVLGYRAETSQITAISRDGANTQVPTGSGGAQTGPHLLLGRAEAEDTLVSMLRSNPDVSIVGPVGCGKSALAARVAARFCHEMNAQVACVDVSRSSVSGGLRETILCYLDGLWSRAQPGQNRIALILDNCDVLHETVNQMAGELKRSQRPGLYVFRTSRRRDQAGSVRYELGPLPSPSPAGPDPEALLASPAVALFCQRAADTRRGFQSRPEQIRAVARICDALDCLPLAIEMAAAQTLAVNAVELEPLLSDDPFAVLRTRRRGSGSPASLHVAFHRTYEQLTGQERTMLRTLGKIDSPLTRSGVVLATAPPGAVAPALDSLVTHSIVALDESSGSLRYRMLRTWRAFARRSARHELVAVR